MGRDPRRGNAHDHAGNFNPHYRRRSFDDILYDADQPPSPEDDHEHQNTELTEREATEWSLFRMLATSSELTPMKVDDLLDRARDRGMDWLWAWGVLRRWLRDGLEKRAGKARVEAAAERWRP